MSAKSVLLAAVVLTLLGWGAARGQAPSERIATLEAAGGTGTGTAGQAAGPSPDDGPHFLSHYITYQRPDCCGPIGGDGQIMYEVYLRGGASLPVGGHLLERDLQDGWMVQGGVRTLCYNPEMDAAWTADLGLGNSANHAIENGRQIPLSILVPGAFTGAPAQRVNFGSAGGPPGVTVRDLNRTYASLALGREWYLGPSVYTCGWKWRFGFDVGGHYGSEKMDFHEIQHRTGVIEAVTVAGHADVEIPCCGVTFLAGLRVEYDYTFSNILQQTTSADLQDLNLLLTAGVRF
jgi:hypothetical protein